MTPDNHLNRAFTVTLADIMSLVQRACTYHVFSYAALCLLLFMFNTHLLPIWAA